MERERLEIVKQIADYMVKTGTSETTSGNYIFYFDEIANQFQLARLSTQLIEEIVYFILINYKDEVSDIDYANCFDINFWLSACKNFEED